MYFQQNNPLRMPKWLSNRGLMIYFAVLGIVSLVFGNPLHPGWMAIGAIEVLVFFYFGNQLTTKWSVERLSVKAFEKNLFRIGVLLRLLMVLGVYIGFQHYYGDAFGFENADATYYNEIGILFADALRGGHFISSWQGILEGSDLSDMGYSTYLSLLYFIFGNDAILVPRFINCIISAYTAVLVYRLGTRNFGEHVGRMGAIFVMLWPNFMFYCATQLKEPMMLFISVLFAEQCDQMFRSRNFTAWKILPVLLLAGAMFTLRTPLALVMVLSILFTVVMSSQRVMGWGKRIAVGGMALILIAITMGNNIQEQSQLLLQQARSDQQASNMEWRSRRDNGNALAKYASKSVFAPLIFTIPFPTMVETPAQYDLKIVNGGNFSKNLMSGFVIFAMFSLLLSGDWRNHLMPLAMLMGYLVVLTMSTFAQSERFHQPAVPFEMMFAAYGLSLVLQGGPVFGKYMPRGNTTTYKRWFGYWSAFIFVACIAWQWFKLKGRGMV